MDLFLLGILIFLITVALTYIGVWYFLIKPVYKSVEEAEKNKRKLAYQNFE